MTVCAIFNGARTLTSMTSKNAAGADSSTGHRRAAEHGCVVDQDVDPSETWNGGFDKCRIRRSSVASMGSAKNIGLQLSSFGEVGQRF